MDPLSVIEQLDRVAPRNEMKLETCMVESLRGDPASMPVDYRNPV
jgi:hypothetical protein